MIRRVGISAALVAAAAAALGGGSAGAEQAQTSATSGGGAGNGDVKASGSTRVKRTLCTVRLSKQQDPGQEGGRSGVLISGGPPGIDFAQISCGKPFGFGAQYDEFRLMPTGGGPNTPSGEGFMVYRAFFNRGRVNGRWEVTFAADDASRCDFNFEVESKWSGGTGKFKGIKGTGRGSGDFTDVENAPRCSQATVTYRMRYTLPR